ncbi:MAG: hypothetical protein ABGW87_00370 [Sphingomonadaceae bacterium]
MLGTPWDYQDRAAEFLTRLNELDGRGIIVCNAPQVVRWNIDKRYLQQLAEADAAIIPTLWHDNPDREVVLGAMEHFACERVVVKRQIGAGALGQHSFTHVVPPDADWCMGRAAMIQPFLPAIVEEGEYSFIFIDSAFSHGVRKRPATGDYRIQSLFGGREEVFMPTPTDLAQAQNVLASLPATDLLYARIDMVRLDDGRLAVMEAELVEPYLYPEQGPELGDRIARAILRRL